MAQKLFISKSSSEKVDHLAAKIKYMDLATLARVAIGISIQKHGKDLWDHQDGSRLKEFNRYSLLGDYESFYKTLFDSVYEKKIDDDDFFSTQSYMRNHIESGITMLYDLYQSCNQDTNQFIAKLIDLSKQGLVSSQDSSVDDNSQVYPLILEIWNNVYNNSIFPIHLNNITMHGNSHLAIMGKPWVGKTQILLNILCQIREKSNFTTNFIFFDYKWEDSIYTDKFLKYTQAEVYSLPKDKLPVNPFILDDYDDVSIKMSAREKADSFSSIGRGFWPVQKWNLQDIIIDCYNQRKGNSIPFPDLNEIYNRLIDVYEERKIKNDTLSETLRWLSDFGLFQSHKDWWDLIDKLYKKTMIVWLNHLPAEWLRELVAYLIIEKLYKEMKSLPESKIENDYRQIRTVLVIDEAHNYLSQKNIFLQKIIREWRSKGIAVFFASQSPSDYEQDDYNFKENLEFSLVLWCNELSPSSVTGLLWCPQNIWKDLAAKISKLNPFEVITKSKEAKEGYTLFQGEWYYKRYS